MTEFVHLHLHTEYSLLDGMIKPKDLMKRCVEAGMSSVAITDHGNMHGVIKFYKAAKDAGVKPIIGCEVYVARGDHTSKEREQGSPFHLVLLAENEIGYRNLVKLVTIGNLEGYYYKPRVDHRLLEKYSEGIIASSACLQGEIARALVEDQEDKARKAVEFYSSVFKDRYYIELQKNGIAEQDKANEGLIKLAKEFDLPMVATNDSHYLLEEHADSHEVLLCIQTGKTLLDENRMRMSTNEFYVKTPEQMAADFPDHPEALKNTLEVAERCNVGFEFGKFIYPIYDLPVGETPDSTFEKMVRDGLEKRWPTIIQGFGKDDDEKEKREIYQARLNEELDLINLKGFASYFLIVQDFINWARENNIPVGPGRGSAAGSLASYSVGITDIDPLRYGLLFERFLNPERKDNPDIDIDFCAHGRDQVIKYTSEKYGTNHVSQIATFGTMKARAAVRDVGRAMGYSFSEVDRVAKMIPEDLGMTLDKAEASNRDLVEAMNNETWVAELIRHAKVLEGTNRHVSTHAAGVVIGDRPLVEYLPLIRDKEDNIVAQWDKKDVEAIGLIKFDFLGLRTLTIIDNALKIIKRVHGHWVDLAKIPMDDPETFELLSAAKSTGVFQLESRGMKELLMRLRPSKIDDLIALVALYRPGPIRSGMIENFINRKHGREEVVYEIPSLEKYLNETYGMIVYQEQVMQVANAVGGFTLGESDLLRRYMSKKNMEKMSELKPKFLEGAKTRKIDQDKAVRIWDLMVAFAEYGFNKSHSAAYGVVSYHTAYLKAHYPVEFMAAMLTMDSGNTDKLMTQIAETREMGIDVLPADVNESVAEFGVSGGKIRFGLAGIKNVGGGAIDSIIECREECGEFNGLSDFCERVDSSKVNKRVIESLIKAGAFDSINPNRNQLINAVEKAMERAARIQRDKASGQISLFGGCGVKDDGPAKDNFDDAPMWSDRDTLDREKEVLGFYLTGHPLAAFKTKARLFADKDSQSLREIDVTPNNSKGWRGNRGVEVRMAGIITTRRFIDYSGGRMAKCTLEDEKGSTDFVIFADAFSKCEEKIRSDEPLLVIGKAVKEEEGAVVDLNVQEAYYLKEVDQILSREAIFTLKAEIVEKPRLEGLKRLIGRFPGKCRPVLRIEIPGKAMVTCRLSQNFCLDPNRELMEEAERLFGMNVLSLR